MRSKVLVTGGAGYLGSVLVPELLLRGYAVTVIDSFLYRQQSLLECCHDLHFRIIRGDARDADLLRGPLAEADYIIPLAALVGAPLCRLDEIGAVTTNRDAVATLVQLASPAQRFVMPCTNSGYGIGLKDAACTEEMPLNPLSLYGRTKVEAEKFILGHGGISLRLATVFGMSPRMRLDLLVNDFTYRAIRDRFLVIFEGHFRRNYIHIRDVAAAFVHAIEHYDAMRGQAFNAGLSDANLTKLELCAKIKEQVPDFLYLEAPVGEDPDKRDYLVSNAKIEGTGFALKHPLEEGIAEIIRGYPIISQGPYGNV
ncbi:MAG: NAD-dependent epimerase/dehydratase family protein [Candidatus Methylomirabilia bacterium]